MKEPKVAKLVESWLKGKYPEKKGFKVSCKIKRKGADCAVEKNDQRIMQVEVKGSKGDIYAGLGQCMWYFCDEHVKTYLAVPYDLPFSEEEIKKVMNYNKAKFGLLKVGKKGSIVIIKEAMA